MARQEGEQGAEVRLGFQKIRINGNWIKQEQRRESSGFL